MAQGVDKQCYNNEIFGIVVAVIGIIALFATKVDLDPHGFWNPYVLGLRGVGWMALLCGCVFTIFALLSNRTDLFDLESRIDADKFAICIAIIFILTAAVLVAVVPHLPATPLVKLPRDPNQRKIIIMQEHNFKVLVALLVVAAGVAVAAIPSIKFFKK